MVSCVSCPVILTAFVIVALLRSLGIPSGATGLFIREAMKRSASTHEGHSETVSVVNIAAKHIARVKRMADVIRMPDDLQFRVGGKNTKANIKLKRVPVLDPETGGSFPIYDITEDGLERIEIPQELLLSKAFYQQDDGSGIVLVSKMSPSSQNFTVDGLVSVMNKQYVIAPVDETNGLGHSHTLKQLNLTLNATDDILFVDKNVTPIFEESQLNTTSDTAKNSLWPWLSRRYIEIAMVADYQAFKRFLEYSSYRRIWALVEMYIYYGFVTLSAGLRYETIRRYQYDVDVRVVPKSLSVCRWAVRCRWVEDHVIKDTDKIVYGEALPAFRKYAADKHKGDHKMLFTGYRLAKPDGGTGVIGIAYVGTGCSDWGVSIVKEFYSSVTSAVAAHELGHSFSAKHDNSADSVGCKNEDFYVMASHIGFPTSSAMAWHPYAFSNCSCNYIRNHLKSAKGECTTNRPKWTMETQFIAGQFYNADAQCALARGVGSTFCRSYQEPRGFDTMCVRMFCSRPDSPSQCVGLVPLHRTSCGNMKWCIRGRCISRSDAPMTPGDRCPQGDDPKVQCDPDLCKSDLYVNVLCCHTCRDVKITTTTSPVTTTSTEYPPFCGKICRCLIDSATVLCFLKCLAGFPCS